MTATDRANQTFDYIVRKLDEIVDAIPRVPGNGWNHVETKADGTRVYKLWVKAEE